MIGLTLRKASPNDSEFAYSVRKAALREYVAKVEGWDEDKQRQLHDRRFGTQDFRVISIDGTDVGIVALVVSSDCLHLYQLMLLPEHQGKEIGRQCMLLLMEEARKLDLPVCLQVMKVNPRARTFYEWLGFVRTGETNTHDLMEWVSDGR